MSIEVKCRCGHTFQAKDHYAGKRGMCPQCGQTVQVPRVSLSVLATEALAENIPEAQELPVATRQINPPMASNVVRGRMAQTQRLVLAKWIQERLCARSPLSHGPFEIAGMCIPSSQAGGDYFDFFKLQDGSLGIAIGDASGHGVESAFLMAQIRLCLRTLAQSYADVGKILERANQLLVGELPPDTFATIGLARLDDATRRLTYVGAGQPPVFIQDANGKVECALNSCAEPLGISAGAVYASSDPIRLNPGAAVLFLTRGILRSPATDGRPFGSHRLLDLLHANRRKPVLVVLEIMQHVVRGAKKNLPLADDLTAVLVVAK